MIRADGLVHPGRSHCGEPPVPTPDCAVERWRLFRKMQASYGWRYPQDHTPSAASGTAERGEVVVGHEEAEADFAHMMDDA